MFVIRAYFFSRGGEVLAVESLPLTPALAGQVWARLSRATMCQWWQAWTERPPLQHGARRLIQPRWEDVKALRRIVIEHVHDQRRVSCSADVNALEVVA